MKQENSMKKAIKILSVSLISVVLLCGISAVMILQNAKYDRVCSANSTAMTCYHYFTNGSIDLSQLTNIPKQGEYYVLGENDSYQNFTAYAGDLFSCDTVLMGNASTSPDIYWAIRIKNGTITELWSSKYQLEETQLRSYTTQEQMKQARFWESPDETRIIGYYSINDSASDMKTGYPSGDISTTDSSGRLKILGMNIILSGLAKPRLAICAVPPCSR